MNMWARKWDGIYEEDIAEHKPVYASQEPWKSGVQENQLGVRCDVELIETQHYKTFTTMLTIGHQV